MEDINATFTTQHYKIRIRESGSELATSTGLSEKPLILKMKRLDTSQSFASDPFSVSSYESNISQQSDANIVQDSVTPQTVNLTFLHSFFDGIVKNEFNFKQISPDEILCSFRANSADPKSVAQILLKRYDKKQDFEEKQHSLFGNLIVEDLKQENRKLREEISKIRDLFDPLFSFDVNRCCKDLLITAENFQNLVSNRRRTFVPSYCGVLTKINTHIHYQTCALTKKPQTECDDPTTNSFKIKVLSTKNSYIMIGLVNSEFEFFSQQTPYDEIVFSDEFPKKPGLEVEHEAEDVAISKTKEVIAENKAKFGEETEGTTVQEEIEDAVPGYRLFSNKNHHPSYAFGLSGCRLYSGGIAEDWGEMITQGDTVSLFFDSKKGKIEIFKNDESLGVPFENVDTSKDYLFVVSLSDVDDKVAIVG